LPLLDGGVDLFKGAQIATDLMDCGVVEQLRHVDEHREPDANDRDERQQMP
jgi:hypothetical protein